MQRFAVRPSSDPASPTALRLTVGRDSVVRWTPSALEDEISDQTPSDPNDTTFIVTMADVWKDAVRVARHCAIVHSLPYYSRASPPCSAFLRLETVAEIRVFCVPPVAVQGAIRHSL